MSNVKDLINKFQKTNQNTKSVKIQPIKPINEETNNSHPLLPMQNIQSLILKEPGQLDSIIPIFQENKKSSSKSYRNDNKIIPQSTPLLDDYYLSSTDNPEKRKLQRQQSTDKLIYKPSFTESDSTINSRTIIDLKNEKLIDFLCFLGKITAIVAIVYTGIIGVLFFVYKPYIVWMSFEAMIAMFIITILFNIFICCCVPANMFLNAQSNIFFWIFVITINVAIIGLNVALSIPIFNHIFPIS